MTSLYTVYTKEIEGGRYYDSCAIANEMSICKDETVLQAFWDLSEKQALKK